MKNKKNISYTEKIILFLLAIIPLIYFNRVESVPVKAFIFGAGHGESATFSK